MAWLILLVGLLWWSPAQATCDSSGTTRTCTAGSSAAQINAAISGVGDQGTVTLNNGTYSAIGISLVGRNGITVKCETVGGCTMTGNDVVFTLESCSQNITNLVRISGFKFIGTAAYIVRMYCTFDITQVRIDHNECDSIGDGNTCFALVEGGGGPPFADRGKLYGVVDHNNCHATTHVFVCLHNGSGGDAWTTGNLGSGNALFFEDNICNMNGRTDLTKACVDNYRAHAMVVRFNTVTNTNLRAHSYCHYGPEVFEVYGNSINTATDTFPGAWDIHAQGSGEQQIWGNLVTADDPGGALHPIATQSYRSDSNNMPQGDCSEIASGTSTGAGTPTDPNDGNRTPLASYYGYPYWHQPGRDGAATLKPMYSFLNRTRGTNAIDHVYVDDGTPGPWTGLAADCANNNSSRVNCHIQKNRDLYWETASFDGTSGTGVGTLASRPATCTPTPDALDAGNGGVGYWATDQGTWKLATPSQGVDIPNGVLYRCKATNTWTTLAESYQPYTYPHPLVSGGTPPDTTPPAAPTGVTISQAVR